MQRALRPVVAAMLFGAFWMVVRPLTKDWRLWLFTLVFFGISRFSPFRKYPQLLLVAAGTAGTILL
ncbi:MAG: hypothetical protein EOM65_01785 [Synergistales bacterium]|nr:hypothetical protein [Synergistales bacterium]